MHTIEDYIPLAEAAAELGYSSRSTVTKLAREGRIPGAVKFSGIWLLPRKWIEEEKIKASGVGKGWKRGKSIGE